MHLTLLNCIILIPDHFSNLTKSFCILFLLSQCWPPSQLMCALSVLPDKPLTGNLNSTSHRTDPCMTAYVMSIQSDRKPVINIAVILYPIVKLSGGRFSRSVGLDFLPHLHLHSVCVFHTCDKPSHCPTSGPQCVSIQILHPPCSSTQSRIFHCNYENYIIMQHNYAIIMPHM